MNNNPIDLSDEGLKDLMEEGLEAGYEVTPFEGDGDQHLLGHWRSPKWGCDSLEHAFDDLAYKAMIIRDTAHQAGIAEGVAEERERCAKILDDYWASGPSVIAAAIRSTPEPPAEDTK